MRFIGLFLGFLTFIIGAYVKADTIYLKPGQCIIVGNQQVCAMEFDKDPVGKVAKPKTQKEKYIFRCKYGKHPGSDFQDLKTYALFRVETKDDGSSPEEIFIQDYGPTKKADCEKEAQKRNAELKNE